MKKLSRDFYNRLAIYMERNRKFFLKTECIV